MTMLKLETIRTDGGTQSRAALNPAVVEDYAQIVRDGTDFPPVVVFHDGKKYWLADGFHRLAAYEKAGAVEIEADIRQGTKRDAILFSVGANSDHGLPRTNDDKRRAVMTLLNDGEWSAWSNREIARRAGVSEKFVRSLRPERSDDDAERTYTTKHGTVAKMDTARIGKAERAERDAEQAEHDADREQARKSLPPHIQRIEEAKARNGSVHAAVAGTVPPRPEPAEHPDAIKAHRDELLEEVAALRNDVAERDRKIATFDAMAAEYEKGGFDQVVQTLKDRIEGLKREVEDVTADRAALNRQVKFWKKTAIDLGYVSQTSIVIEEPAKAPDLSEEAGF